jgi:hypothetical protein
VKGLDDEIGGKIAQEAHLGLPAEACGEQIADLGDDKRGDDQRAGVGFQQLQAGSMVGIVCVYVGVERAGIDDQRDVASSALMISSMRSEMSLRPLRPAAAAPKRSASDLRDCHSPALGLVAQLGIQIILELNRRPTHRDASIPCRITAQPPTGNVLPDSAISAWAVTHTGVCAPVRE